ncbi:MAG: hypothetical protein NDI80_08585 [Flavobacteriaceae bacterium]|nr:hypothetical protein [Flavobacteriaceae bacterium]
MNLENQNNVFESKEVVGNLVMIGDERYYKISNVDEMRPFFMSILSNSNHWFFLSSNGGLTAGRKNSNYSLFPYYTDDKITEAAPNTGSKTIIRVYFEDKIFIWEPFSTRNFGKYQITRNLYKNDYGNKVLFEEINHNLGLTFKYQWATSDDFGFIKTSFLENQTTKPIHIAIVDGLRNILPYGVPQDLQNSASNLVDAYKKCELEADAKLGIYSLSAIIVDRAEPSEALKANITWSLGLENATCLLSTLQLDRFRKFLPLTQEDDIRAEKGAYFLNAEFNLNAEEEKTWMTISDVNKTVGAIIELKETIKKTKDFRSVILNDIQKGTDKLIELAAASDGIQLTEDSLRNNRHFANTMFNIMRGGIFDDNYTIEKKDFNKYLQKANIQLYKEQESFLNKLPETFRLDYLKKLVEKEHNANLKRLATEYLPLKFSRRHGDPSRPWNKFSINTKNEDDGSKVLDYEGNWRDIFQNWEALAHSYPEFIEGMIFKFLNASTFDGYNPYRVIKDGFEWEEIEPNNPWSYIGYWGDHQIIYLLKFLEFANSYYPNKLNTLFNKEQFVYANVPYKIKSYNDILSNPKDTIDFDEKLNLEIHDRKKQIGADGALLCIQENTIYQVNLIEKILATLLAKVSNFIPEGGIWLNTQRPEWNDANNALVGNGVSMVTLYYIRRFLNFLLDLNQSSLEQNIAISSELVAFFRSIFNTLVENQHLLQENFSDIDRKKMQDALGTAASNYRNTIYKNGFCNKKIALEIKEIQAFIQLMISYADHTISANKRSDNLYHSYNLVSIKDNKMELSYLPEMLEGQVALLSSGYLSNGESAQLLNALKCSKLFRPDQFSYILYPNKDLPRFIKKNNIKSEYVESSDLLKNLIKSGNKQLVEKDVLGNYHFNGNFNNAQNVKKVLETLRTDIKYTQLVEKEKHLILDIFEEVFEHKSFTGRSGTFFGYEGLGSIYWHMVSKLLLSVQETCIAAIKNQEDPVIVGNLLDHYYEINEGIGVHKSPKLYGAIPTDPYSHTPAGKGAQQPGMTGQVKEDILTRMAELGVFVENGCIHFNPSLLRKNEFLSDDSEFSFYDIQNNHIKLSLPKGSLAFTYCQIPIIYKKSDYSGIAIYFDKDTPIIEENLVLNQTISKSIFERSGVVKKIEVAIPNFHFK